MVALSVLRTTERLPVAACQSLEVSLLPLVRMVLCWRSFLERWLFTLARFLLAWSLLGAWRSSSFSYLCGGGSAKAAALRFQESGLFLGSGVLRPRGSSGVLERRRLVMDPVSAWTPAR
ncbi:unnamed protein product [Brassica napus]|uniref:(rape) hypothetical protein n=1 Tax=Brassica napus TaxID=3708 RepID=A0A817AP85_BRANA|nr:unnamed protein product [Brassica napus]